MRPLWLQQEKSYCRFLKPLILNFFDGHDKVHAGLGVNQENFSPVQFCKKSKKTARNRNRKVSCLLPCPLRFTATVTVPSPSLGRATGKRVALRNFSAAPGPASVAPNHPESRHEFRRHSRSRSQEASDSFNHSLFSLRRR